MFQLITNSKLNASFVKVYLLCHVEILQDIKISGAKDAKIAIQDVPQI